jgi:hypothetical protein
MFWHTKVPPPIIMLSVYYQRSLFVSFFEDTRPQNQLNAAKEQHNDLCNILQETSVTLHIILLLGVSGTIYNTHTLKPFKELGLDSQRVKELPPSSMCTL